MHLLSAEVYSCHPTSSNPHQCIFPHTAWIWSMGSIHTLLAQQTLGVQANPNIIEVFLHFAAEALTQPVSSPQARPLCPPLLPTAQDKGYILSSLSGLLEVPLLSFWTETGGKWREMVSTALPQISSLEIHSFPFYNFNMGESGNWLSSYRLYKFTSQPRPSLWNKLSVVSWISETILTYYFLGICTNCRWFYNRSVIYIALENEWVGKNC